MHLHGRVGHSGTPFICQCMPHVQWAFCNCVRSAHGNSARNHATVMQCLCFANVRAVHSNYSLRIWRLPRACGLFRIGLGEMVAMAVMGIPSLEPPIYWCEQIKIPFRWPPWPLRCSFPYNLCKVIPRQPFSAEFTHSDRPHIEQPQNDNRIRLWINSNVISPVHSR